MRQEVTRPQDADDFLPKDGTPNGTSVDEGWYIDLPRVLRNSDLSRDALAHERKNRSGPFALDLSSQSRRSNGNNLFHYCLNEHVNGTFRQADQTIFRKGATPVVWLSITANLPPRAQNNVHTNLHNAGLSSLSRGHRPA